MNEDTFYECDHPLVDVKEMEPLPDGNPVLMAKCLCCGETDWEIMAVEYAPKPVPLAGRWYPMVTLRANLAICAGCGRPIFSQFEVPYIFFIKGDDDVAIGEVDFCRSCGMAVYQRMEGQGKEGQGDGETGG